MGNDYASIHVFGLTKNDIESLILPNNDIPVLTRQLNSYEEETLSRLKLVLGENFISEFKTKSFNYVYMKQKYKFIENKDNCSVFSPAFDACSLPDRINLSFKYDNAPLVLGFATEYETVIHIWLYKNCEIISEICYCCDLNELGKWCDTSEIEFGFRDVKRFEEYFNFNEFDLINLFEASKSFDVLCKRLSIMFALPFTKTFETIPDSTGNGFLCSQEKDS